MNHDGRPIVALVLAGGTGTRLYPASRSDRPKQFLALDGERSLLAETVERASFAAETFVSTRPAFADEVRERAPEAAVIVEPAARDTGPALLYATHRIREAVGDCVVLALPSDHRVEGAFASVAERGARVAAETGAPVVFGVEPTRPETGYGYVEPGRRRDLAGGEAYYDLDAFHEKPDPEAAARYVESGYLWNAGMFAWTPEALFAAAEDTPLDPLLDALEPGSEEGDAADATLADVPEEIRDGFAEVPEVSIDRAVMERADEAAVVPATFEWDDLGSWDALERVFDAEDADNVALGEALAVDAADNVVASDDKHVSLVGVEDLCVVAWGDRVLVVPKGQAQRVREVVDRLKERGEF